MLQFHSDMNVKPMKSNNILEHESSTYRITKVKCKETSEICAHFSAYLFVLS
jgi:hypothetical protein